MKRKQVRSVFDLQDATDATEPLFQARRDMGWILAARVLERLARTMRALDLGDRSRLTEHEAAAIGQLGLPSSTSASYVDTLEFVQAVVGALRAEAAENDLLVACAEDMERLLPGLRAQGSGRAREAAAALEMQSAVLRRMSADPANAILREPFEDGTSARSRALATASEWLNGVRRRGTE